MDLRNALVKLFTEAFEGVQPGATGTYFVQGTEALLPILAATSAQEASEKPAPDVSSVAAHTIHATYYVHLLNEFIAGRRPEINWEKSWAVQTVSEEEWNNAREDLGREYHLLRSTMETIEVTDPEHQIYLLAQLPHAAFHLGSIRQLLWFLRSR
ncbi:MAG: hypothetical protein JST40_11255 [Armatimonadetes bacterium]|nr:hypothetical protein [Armatimonadota bacterium]